MSWGPGAALIGLLLLPPGLVAAGPAARVTFTGERYHIHAESVVPAPPQRVMAVLTDYAAMGRIHPVVSRVRVTHRDGNEARVHLLLEDCVLVFCLNIRQNLHYRRVGRERLEAEVEPEGSDFSYGRLVWRVEETAPGTSHVRFEAHMEPTFWLPPILGTFALEQRLKQVAMETQTNLGLLVQGKRLPTQADPVPGGNHFFDDPHW